MKKIFTALLRRLPLSVMISCTLLPVPVVLFAKYAPSLLPFIWVFPTAFALMDTLSSTVRGKWRIPYALLELGALVFLSIRLLSSAENRVVILIPIMYAITALVELPPNADKRSFQIRLISYSIVGIALHLIAQFFRSASTLSGDPILEPLTPWLLGGFFLFIFCGAIMLNRTNLAVITQGRLLAGVLMKRKNLLLTLAFLGIPLLIACIPGAVTAVSKLFQWLIVAILMLLNLLGSMGKAPVDMSLPTETGENIFAEPTPDGVRPEWLEALIVAVTVLILAFVAFYVLLTLSRWLKALIRYLDKQLRSYLNAVSEDYIDEISDTREDPDHVRRRAKKPRVISPLELGKLSANERIRYRYRQLLRQNPQWPKGSTPRENLKDAASVYEAVRYGEQTATDADARKFSEETKKK